MDCVQLFVKAGADVSKTDVNGMNAVHYACRAENGAIIEVRIIFI